MIGISGTWSPNVRAKATPKNRSTLQFSLKHSAADSALVVSVVKATGLLPPGGNDAEVNPYVKVRLEPGDKHQKAKTKVRSRSKVSLFSR